MFIKALITQDGDIYKFRKTHPKTEGVVAEILKQSRHMVINNQALFYALIQGQIKTQQCQKLFRSGMQSSCCQDGFFKIFKIVACISNSQNIIQKINPNQGNSIHQSHRRTKLGIIEKAKTYHEHLEEFKEKPGGGNNDHHPLALEESSTFLHMKVFLDCFTMLNHLGILLVLLNRSVPLHPIHKALVGIFRARNEMISVVRM